MSTSSSQPQGSPMSIFRNKLQISSFPTNWLSILIFPNDTYQPKTQKGKKVSFDKVLTMVDEMVTLLKKEQVHDDDKKEYCENMIDTTEDKAKWSRLRAF